MGYWDTQIVSVVKPEIESGVIANTYPIYEIQSPQYQYPSSYQLANQGYRGNEIAFSAINKRASSVSEGYLRVYKDTKKGTPKEIHDHPLTQLLHRPNESVSEEQFWQITMISLLTSGFCAWEKEYSNQGDVINLWAMRPDWCSFYRGQGRPTRAIRYQPYGLPAQDVGIDDIVLFRYFDPLFPLLKGLSPLAVLLKSIIADNAATEMLKVFFERGTVTSGVLKTDQNLSPDQAQTLRDRWKIQHAGGMNWWDIAVLGNGAEYKSSLMNFKDMDFTNIDGRTEARICMAIKVPPILLNAKVGLSASTYSNYEQSQSAFYDDPIQPDWKYLAKEIQAQLLPDFEGNKTIQEERKSEVICDFDTSKVKALQENRDKKWKRATEGAKGNVITRDEAREEMGLDPIDNDKVFVGATVRISDTNPQDAETIEGGETDPGNEDPKMGPKKMPKNVSPQDDTAKRYERKLFSEFARKRIKEGKPQALKDFDFKYHTPWEKDDLIAEYMPNDIAASLDRLASILEKQI
jgi:HK97 family phage portal protein